MLAATSYMQAPGVMELYVCVANFFTDRKLNNAQKLYYHKHNTTHR